MQTVGREVSRTQNAVEMLLRCYKLLISPLFGHSCRFSPSCSEYVAQAIVEQGWWRGSAQAAKRVLRCHPFGTSGYDPVPRCSSNQQLRP